MFPFLPYSFSPEVSIVLHGVAFLLLASLVFAWLSLAPWVPAEWRDLVRIHRLARLRAGQTFLEMGCGNGRVCTYIARHNPTAQVVGVELALPFFLIAWVRRLVCGPRNLRIVYGDALRCDISHVEVLYTYGLTSSVNTQVKKKISAELQPGARLISYVFRIVAWPGTEKVDKPADRKAIYVYEK